MKLLTIDIETRPALGYFWALRDQTIPPAMVVEPVEMICFAAKWLDRRKVHFRSVHHDGQEAMLAEVYDLLDEADAVIHYNGTSFDVPHINRELKQAGYTGPPSPFDQIDLYRTVRSKFRFLSNKLDSVARDLDIGAKVAHEGFGLWKRCMAGDDLAWAKMRKYNIGDVKLTEELYLEIRPWISPHPAVSLDGTCCPRCGSDDLQKRGVRRTTQAAFQRYQCRGCGGFSRSTKRLEGSSLRSIV